jgi:hypothetical protein
MTAALFATPATFQNPTSRPFAGNCACANRYLGFLGMAGRLT